LRALSIRQPYAWAIIRGFKPVENRSWSTDFRGTFLIHAGKLEERDDVELVIRQLSIETPYSYQALMEDYQANQGLGCIVAVAKIVDCVTYHKSHWFYGPYGFVIENPLPIKPIPYKGKLNFFYVPDDLKLEILEPTQPKSSFITEKPKQMSLL
jgi:hypothetical protein